MLIYNQETPILFLIFNRPENTEIVFRGIKKVKPLKLYIAADGPRSESEKGICEETREIILKIDWPCDLKTLFRDNNLGCKDAVSSSITWFFDNEEEGIVLEDDCLPSDSFFGFCSQMLEKYRHNERIGHIAGSNFQLGNVRDDGSYYFSNLTHVWGWAGWRRVWKDYDVNINSFPKFKKSKMINKSPSHTPFKEYWLSSFESTYDKKIDTWDYQYAYLNLLNNRLSIMPNFNMISNIGVGANSTHTQEHPFGNLKLTNLDVIIHPSKIQANIEADLFTQKIEYGISELPKRKNIFSRTWKSIKNHIKAL